MTVVEKDPGIEDPQYEVVRRSGADRATLTRNLAECNFYGLRRLEAYLMAGADKRKAFSRDLAMGKLLESCPFPLEVALLRALHMGADRWRGGEETPEAAAKAFVDTVRFGVMAPHLSAVVEYPPEVFFRAFQGVEVHRDVPYLEDSSPNGGDARSLDWMDFRIYSIPPLEKDFCWDLFLMDRSPWAKTEHEAISTTQVARPENRDRRPLPIMVARQRNRHRGEVGRPMIGMVTPGASLHLTLVSGDPDGIGELLPTLFGSPVENLPAPATPVGELRENESWLVITYNPPPPMADARLMVVPPQFRVEDAL
jgi:hypothetical protein